MKSQFSYKYFEAQYQLNLLHNSKSQPNNGATPPDNFNIAPLTFARYSKISFEQLLEDQVFDSRFLLCQVFSEKPIKSIKGNFSFLVHEFSSECKKVVRVQIKSPPANWNANFFKKG